jgi:hypothetical protein
VIFVSGARSWSLELPSDWEVVPSEWEPGFTASRERATLRVLELSSGQPRAVSDTQGQQVVEVNRAIGRSVVAVAYGAWSGHLIEVEDEGLWCRCWLLAAAADEVEVTYACPREEAGRDDRAIDNMLRSLPLGDRAA